MITCEYERLTPLDGRDYRDSNRLDENLPKMINLRVHFSKDVVLLVKLCEFRRLTCGRYARRISSAMRTLTDCRSTCKRSFCSQTRFRGLFLQETPSGRTLRHREHSNLASRLVSHRGSNTGKSGRNAFYERCFQTTNDFLVW